MTQNFTDNVMKVLYYVSYFSHCLYMKLSNQGDEGNINYAASATYYLKHFLTKIKETITN